MDQLQAKITTFLQHCQFERNLSAHTLKAYRLDLKNFSLFAKESCGSDAPLNIEKNTIKGFAQKLHKFKPRTQRRRMAALKSFFGYLEREELIEQNPMANIRLNIRVGRPLPRTVGLSTLNGFFDKIYAIRNAKPARSKAGNRALRDVALFELMFSSGMRVSELSNLEKEAVDLVRASVLVKGKGSKERVIPICGDQVLVALSAYAAVRAKEAGESRFFFTNRLGKRFSEQSIRLALARHVESAGLEKITPHVFRHTIATMLLEQGVDLRFIQNLLGHSSIVTTTIYVHVTQKSQREVLDQRHPRRLLDNCAQSQAVRVLSGNGAGLTYTATHATLKLKFIPKSDSCCCKNGRYRWYQTITKDTEPLNASKAVPRPDVGPPNLAPSYNLAFVDMPTIPNANIYALWINNGNQKVSIEVEFKLDLQCEQNGKIKTLKTIKWGFWAKIDQNNMLSGGLR